MRLRVLVVVRCETAATAIQIALEKAGFETTVALSCAEARQCAWLGPFAVGVIDVELVDGSGIELGDWLSGEAHVCASVFRAKDSWCESTPEPGQCLGPVIRVSEPAQHLVVAVGQLAQDVLQKQLAEVDDILRRNSVRPATHSVTGAVRRGRITVRPSRPPDGRGGEAAH